MSIIVRNVTKKYGNQLALNGVSFSTSKGEIVGFIGPNGAGKSTLMKIVTGYLAADEGEVLVNNLDVSADSIEIRKIIGYLPESNPLYTDMWVVEYLNYVTGLYGLRKMAGKLIPDIIERAGLGPEKNKKIGVLSKGYRQRVGLAQALIHDPEILILDEPTSGLDPNQIVEIRNLISLLGKEKTVLLSTHIMQEVEAICDRVVIIDKGKIVADEEKGKIRSERDLYQTIIIEFSESIDEEKLKLIPGVQSTLMSGKNTWVIQSVAEEDLRPVIFEFAVNNRLKVLSMQEQKKKLEEVFRDLTQGIDLDI